MPSLNQLLPLIFYRFLCCSLASYGNIKIQVGIVEQSSTYKTHLI